MKWIGLTGGIATGKSTVSKRFAELGVPVVDADQLAHQVMKKNGEAYAEITDHFGQEILGADGEIDRKKLGARVFANPRELRFLEEKIHPWVQKKVGEKRQELQQQGYAFALYDVPLLFEKNLQKQFDAVIVVDCETELQVKRLMSRNKISRAEAEERLAQQWETKKKAALADHVILNNGTLSELFYQVNELAAILKK